MPLKLNVGLSRKIGQPNYGSLGASCHLEMELESSLLRDDLNAFQHHVRKAFATCRQAVADELSEPQSPELSNGNEHHNGSSNRILKTNTRLATASQVRAIHAIANQHRIDLTSELHSRFNVNRPDELAIAQASELIDALKAASHANNGHS
ncbi:MAG: hypothetical protein COA78_09110 [Blastopirellula sp.]|nr:MAG: hypothetical protein COA78_09110 [Blastopirellula sp.]